MSDKQNSVYRDIAERTGGDIYIGVVGPVRTDDDRAEVHSRRGGARHSR